jgi:ectoine hydroxylase-related dioxygenase (phytanoyl-CoA dioxygenase family)
MAVADYAKLLSDLKPAFIHHPESKRHIRQILVSMGCDLDRTYFEVPKLRSSTSDNYLTAGIAYAWHPHRDTWYSAPQCQINWWMPIYPIDVKNCMAFHPTYFNSVVENTSADYNYYEWNIKFRGPQLIEYVNEDPRPLPKPKHAIDHASDLRLVCPPGGMIVFSGAHLHSSVPNTSGKTRFSLDFRTAHIEDLVDQRGAPNIDSSCTGTVLQEFHRASDLADVPRAVAAAYEDGTEFRGESVFRGPERL